MSTYINYNKKETTIDVALSNMTHNQIEMNRVPLVDYAAFTDHIPYIFKIPVNKSETNEYVISKTKMKKDSRGKNMAEVINSHILLNFPQNFEVEMVADALEFINLTHEINYNFLPLNKIKLQKRVELFKKDARVRKILKLRTEYMEKNNFHTPRTVDFGLQIFNKVLNKLLVKARRNYWTNSLSKLEQKDDMWSIFKQFKNKKTHIPHS